MVEDDRAATVFKLAVGLDDPRERSALLDRECEGNDVLRREVESLLDADASAGGFLRPPFSGVASKTNGARGVTSLIGTTVGAYEVVRVIGSGGMGTVYEARQQRPRRTVALKVMNAALASRSMRRRFEYEVEALARLRHPGIAQIHEAGVHPTDAGPLPYFAMEHLADARPITQFAQEERLSRSGLLALFASVCDAVHYGHQRGVIHRDLKPGNILVDRSSDRPQPKVIDFGIARFTDGRPDGDVTLTRVGPRAVGTPRYMSPEQCTSDRDALDVRSDVYSLGVVLYELLTGGHPFGLDASSSVDVSSLARDAEPRRPSAVDPSVRGDLETIVLKAIASQPTARYQSALELAADVRRYLRNEPIVARRATALYQLRKFTRRNRTLVGGIAAVFFLLVVSSIGMTVLFVRALDAEQTAIRNLDDAKRQAAMALAYSEFLDAMITGADPDVARGRDTTLLRDLLDQAVIDARTGLGDLPEVQADVEETLGRVYQSLGLFDEAEDLLRNALHLRTTLPDVEATEIADALFGLALLLRARVEHDKAEEVFREVLAIREQVLPSDHADVIEAVTTLAVTLAESEDAAKRAEAEALVRPVLRYHERHPGRDPEGYSAALVTRALLLQAEGHFAAAAETMREVLAIRREIHGNQSTAVASNMAFLGSLLRWSGDLDEAEAVLRETIELRERLLGDRHYHLTWPSIELARTLTARGALDEAERLCRNAVEIRIESLGERHLQVAEAMEPLGDVLAARGERARAAEVYHDVIVRYAEALGDDHPWVDDIRAKLAAVLDEGG